MQTSYDSATSWWYRSSCGLTVTSADKFVGGRAAGSFDGDVTLSSSDVPAGMNQVVHLSATFDLPVTQ
jgi:hypothetical protein